MLSYRMTKNNCHQFIYTNLKITTQDYKIIEMQRISSRKPPIPKTILTKLFIIPSTNSRSLQLILLILECTIYSYLISSFASPARPDHPDNRTSMLKHIGIHVDWLMWVVVLGICLAVRLGLGGSIIRGLYLVCIGWLMQVPTPEINTIQYTIICTLLGILLTIDILSHTQLLFNTKNPYSQTLNITKFLHYTILPLTLILYHKITTIPSYVVTIINIILFAVLLVVKIKSICSNTFFKCILSRFYVLVIGYLLRNLVRFWVDLLGRDHAGYQHLIVIASTQLLYTIIQYKNSRLQVDIQISNGNIINVIYTALAYLHSNTYNQHLEQVIEQLLTQTTMKNRKNALNIANNILQGGIDVRGTGKIDGQDMRDDNRVMEEEMESPLQSAIVPGSQMYSNSSQLNMMNNRSNVLEQGLIARLANSGDINEIAALLAKKDRLNSRKVGLIDSLNKTDLRTLKVAQKSLQLLESTIANHTDNPIQCSLLIAQIKFTIYNNLIMSRSILQKLKSQLFPLSFINRICIYKLEYNIQSNISTNYSIESQPEYLQFFDNELIRNSIIRNTYDYLEMWKYVQNSDAQFSKLSGFMEKVLRNSKAIDAMYQSVPYKCQTIVELYVQYLYMVRRDVETAKNINRMCVIYEQSGYNLNIQNKIYICLGMQQNSRMIIENVSFNIKKLLGYDRCNVKYNHASIFMPSFFVQEHEKMVSNALHSNEFNLYVFNKSIILKNNDEYYEPARLEVKLVYNVDGELKMEGYIQLETSNYLVNNQDSTSGRYHSSYNYYNWSNYFFMAKEDQQILEVSPCLREIIDLKPRKFVHCGDYFDNCPNTDSDSQSQPGSHLATQDNMKTTKNIVRASIRTCRNIPIMRKYLYNNGMQYEYIMYRALNLNNHKQYLYYVCKNTEEERDAKLANLGTQNNNQSKLNIMYKISGVFDLSSFKYTRYPLKYQDFETNLEQFFTNKKKIVETMSTNKVPIMFGITVFLLLVVFALQGVLMGRVQIIKASNTVIKDDMTNLIEFYHDLDNIGMVIERFASNVKKGVIFYYEYYVLQNLCLSLQKLNQYLEKFDLKVYSLPADYVTQNLQYPKSLKQLISQLLSSIMLVTYVKAVSQMQLIMVSFKNLCEIFELIWGKGLTDYLTVYLQSVDQTVNEDNRIKLGLSIGVIIILLVVYVLVIKIDDMKRDYEFQVINLISGVNSSTIFCNSTNQFLRRSVGGINEKDFTEKKSPSKSNKNITLNNSKLELGGTISARQNSVRGLFEESMMGSGTNRSGFHNAPQQSNTLPYNTLEMKEKREQDQSIRKKEKIRPRSKLMLFVWTLAFLIAVGIIVTYLITDFVGNQVSLIDSVKNLLIILNKSTQLSSTIISYLHMINLDKPNTLFLSNYNSYQQLEKQNPSVIFDEASYAEFSNFSSLLQKVNYAYLCQYMPCKSQYKDEINIMYNSAVHKFNSYMFDNANFGNKKIEGETKHQIQLLFYAHYLLQSTIYNLLQTYLSDYNRYQVNKYMRIYLFYECQLVAFGIFFILCLVYYCVHFRSERQKYLWYLEFIKRDSYEEKFQDS